MKNKFSNLLPYTATALVLIIIITWILAFIYNFCAYYLVHSSAYYNELAKFGSRVCDGPDQIFSCQKDSLITLYKNGEYGSVLLYFLGGILGSTFYGALFAVVNLFWEIPLAFILSFALCFNEEEDLEKEMLQKKSQKARTVYAKVL